MNYIIKILQPQTLSSVSCKLLNLFEGAKILITDTRYLKLRQIIVGGSFIIVACYCLSRHSTEEDILPSENVCLTADVKTLKVRDFDSEGTMKRNTTETIPNALDDNLYSFIAKNNFVCKPNYLTKLHSQTVTAENVVVSHTLATQTEPQLKKIKTEAGLSKKLNKTDEKGLNSEFHLLSTPSHEESPPEKPRKERPNYFIAIQIFNKQIIQGLKEVQDHILEQEHRLKKSMSKLETLHITLMVMSIKDQETLNRAKEVLQKIHEEYDDDLSKNPVQLKFRGLNHFNNKVLYAELLQDNSFDRLISIKQGVENHYEAASIFSTDTRKGFTPHLTVAKIDFKHKNRGVKKINPLLYEEFADQYFGSQRVESIQLLSMTGPKTGTGYYSGHELVFSAYNSSNRMDSLKNLLGIDEQKKEIKEKINKLLKEKLK